MEMTEQMYLETLKTIQNVGSSKSDLPEFLDKGIQAIMEFIRGENETKNNYSKIPTYIPTRKEKFDKDKFAEKIKEINEAFSSIENNVEDKTSLIKLKQEMCLHLVKEYLSD